MATYEQSPQDEGYSEDPLTVGVASLPMPAWLASMSVSNRTGMNAVDGTKSWHGSKADLILLEYVMAIIDKLPTSQVCEIVRRLRPRIYINFFRSLPPEIILKILGFLDPVSLVHTARASREWMLLATDSKLWEELYILEGFRVIRPEVLKFEALINDKSRSSGLGDDEHASKRRATPQRILPNLQSDDDFEMVDVDTVQATQESLFGPYTSEPKDSRVKGKTSRDGRSHGYSLSTEQKSELSQQACEWFAKFTNTPVIFFVSTLSPGFQYVVVVSSGG